MSVTELQPVQIVTCEGDPVNESKIIQGVILQAPDVATFQRKKALVSRHAKVALYNVSMAGDTDEWFSDGIKIETAGSSHDVNIESAVLRQMLKVAEWLLASGVDIIACQKCVHPALKQYLRDKVCMQPILEALTSAAFTSFIHVQDTTGI